jgi:hypothetical protein
MQTSTGGWAVLPDVPWTTTDGMTYRELGARADATLTEIRSTFRDASEVEIGVLAEKVGDLCLLLRDLARSELPVKRIYRAAWRDCLASLAPPRIAKRRQASHLQAVPTSR